MLMADNPYDEESSRLNWNTVFRGISLPGSPVFKNSKLEEFMG